MAYTIAGIDIETFKPLFGLNEELGVKIETIFTNPEALYIHAYNAMHGCFVTEIRRVRP